MEFQDYAIKQTFEKWDDMMLVFLTTVDGRNIPPVDSLSHYLQGFVHPISSINGMKFACRLARLFAGCRRRIRISSSIFWKAHRCDLGCDSGHGKNIAESP